MASDIRAARKYKFDIEVSDPDTDRADQAIARIEVVSGSGTVVADADFDSHEVHWKPVVPPRKSVISFWSTTPPNRKRPWLTPRRYGSNPNAPQSCH